MPSGAPRATAITGVAAARLLGGWGDVKHVIALRKPGQHPPRRLGEETRIIP